MKDHRFSPYLISGTGEKYDGIWETKFSENFREFVISQKVFKLLNALTVFLFSHLGYYTEVNRKLLFSNFVKRRDVACKPVEMFFRQPG